MRSTPPRAAFSAVTPWTTMGVVTPLDPGRLSTSAVIATLVLGLGLAALLFLKKRSAQKRAVIAEAVREMNARLRREAEVLFHLLTQQQPSASPLPDEAGNIDPAIRRLRGYPPSPADYQFMLRVIAGCVCRAFGLPHEAICLQEVARDHFLATYGPEHRDALNTMNQLAASYAAAARLDDARQLVEEVVRIRRKLNGRWDPELLTEVRTMNNLAASYFAAGRQDDAFQLVQEAMVICREVRTPELDLDMVWTPEFDCWETGLRWKALKALIDFKNSSFPFPDPHCPNTRKAMMNLSVSCYPYKRQGQTIELGKVVMWLHRELFGLEHPDALGVMVALAHACSDAGLQFEANKVWEQVLAISCRMIGRPAPESWTTIHRCGP